MRKFFGTRAITITAAAAILGTASLLGTAIAAHAESQLLCGDLNLSESITSSDALLILKAAVGQQVPIECAPAAMVLRTGQVECSDQDGNVIPCDGTGQDAAEDKGVARNYVASPDGTITDLATSLVWEAFTDDGGEHDKDNVSWWFYAFAHVEKLNAEKFGGYDDWRVPNAFELDTLANFGQGFPAAFHPAFEEGCVPGCTVGECRCLPAGAGDQWSSTSSIGDTKRVWVHRGKDGSTWDADKTSSFPTRAVRGGKISFAMATPRSPLTPYFGCADINGSGSLTSSDALLDLKSAVGQDVEALCPPSTGLPKTGQTTCSYPGGNEEPCLETGQDGDTQRGVPRTFHDNGDGTVTDDSNGLQWEKLTMDGSIHDNGWQYMWVGAVISKIAQLNAMNFAGHNDWRVPNILELLTTLDLGKYLPATVDAFDSGCTAGCTNLECSCSPLSGLAWTSTSNAHGASEAWLVDYSYGSHFTQAKTEIHNVRAVRGGV